MRLAPSGAFIASLSKFGRSVAGRGQITLRLRAFQRAVFLTAVQNGKRAKKIRDVGDDGANRAQASRGANSLLTIH
jgi:hypothetical protein